MVLALILAQAHVEGRHADVFGEAEAARAVSVEADKAGARFREIFGSAPLRAAIVLTVDGRPARDAQRDVRYTKHGAKWVWRWEPKLARESGTPMAHELAHLWLLFWADGPQPKPAPYGSSLPDWMDEGVASLFEGADYSALLRKTTRAPLSGFLAWRHPDSRGEGEKPTDRVLFYAQSWSVVKYLESRGALGHVAATLKSGKRFEDALGKKGLPATIEEFEKAWKESP